MTAAGLACAASFKKERELETEEGELWVGTDSKAGNYIVHCVERKMVKSYCLFVSSWKFSTVLVKQCSSLGGGGMLW